jgi:eukaryotic-like serine/threonine-protein kinase
LRIADCQTPICNPQSAICNAPSPAATLTMLEGLSYVEAVLWLVARLADGLAHAHERGVVHRDLKPANILLADDGQPMLLDFNLSDNPRLPGGAAAAGMGGTLPYMSPEQLEAFRGGGRPVDGRSDLYAVGVILCELLTRRHPFPVRNKCQPDLLATMIQDRLQSPPRLRRWNRSVSPAVEAITRRCLEPDPDRRYPTARALKEDLERHLGHLPLRHTPEPSLRERLRKWRLRHPSLASSASLGAAAAALFAVLLAVLVGRSRQLDRLQAVVQLQRTGKELCTAQIFLLDHGAGPEQRAEGVRLCQDTLQRYQVLGNPSWRQASAVRRLTPEERDQLFEHLGEMLFLLARVTGDRAVREWHDTSSDPELRQALDLNTLALGCYDGRAVPRALWEQRADLARFLDGAEEHRARREARETPPRPDKDGFLSAHRHAAQGNYRKALPLLRQATQRDPQSFAAWFVRGVCHLELLQDAEAAACFNSCVALAPEFPWSWYNRGLAHRRQRHHEQALADFDRVVALQPALVKAYVNRALARQGLGDHAGAVRDLTRALELAEGQGGPGTSIHFLRATARARAKDPEGARRDREEGMRREPADEDGFVDRGLARVASDPEGALADFERALQINPRSFRGLQNKAALLVDKFGRDDEALRVLDAAVRLYPDSALARGGRGVLRARVGKRAQALEDAQEALLLDASPPMLYQVACVYALTSRQQAEDRVKALQLLSSALGKGYGLDLIDQDNDLDPVRNLPEYRRLVEAARSLQARSR